MTPEQQRTAIAEACGWSKVEQPPETKDAWGHAGRPKEKQFWFTYQIPDYLNDMNAMHEAEKYIVQFENMMLYRDCLFNSVGLNPLIWAHQCPAPEFLRVAGATAAQRAEAFLKTIGKWEDAK